jgi:hypothetical protein
MTSTRPLPSAPHVYIQCDLPEDVTIAEFKRARRPVRSSTRRGRRGFMRLLDGAVPRESRPASS